MFMHRLNEQLKYFISKKITEDSNWKNVTVVLSGYDTPGEGEHKIMEYIRSVKSNPGYNPNTRHCLYGLDADLIMLGLVSHEPHFVLLREEVKFGPSRKKTSKKDSKQTFLLLHLSLMREYLNYEFKELDGKLKFPFEFEKCLDDYVLMSYFIGNDFLPNLPDLHVNEGGLDLLFKIYKQLLPTFDGYMNEDGILHVGRCKKFFLALQELELEKFQLAQADRDWISNKKNSTSGFNKYSLLARQKPLYLKIREYVTAVPKIEEDILFNWSKLNDVDRKLMLNLVKNFGLTHDLNTEDYEDTFLVVNWGSISESDDGSESEIARQRILQNYDLEIDQFQPKDIHKSKEVIQKEQLTAWKCNYYREKLEFPAKADDHVKKLVFDYFEGMQWVLHYYYHGVQSWSWFFPHHYAPIISDLQLISDDTKFEFTLGEPFRPFDQLLAVLPPLSKELVPSVYQDLMTDYKSPIIDFYPETFDTDLNGKKNDWEAIVKIPFIDEKRLIDAVHRIFVLNSKGCPIINS